MLKAIQTNYKARQFEDARAICKQARSLLKDNMLFNVYAGMIEYNLGDKNEAYLYFARATSCRGPFSLAEVAYRNLAILGAYKSPARILEFESWSDDPENALVVMTMTSCKRLDLLQRTLVSLRNIDLDMISEIFIVDDGSDADQLKEVTSKCLARAKLFLKNENARGHARSLNVILAYLQQTRATYVVHIEDDFEFLFPHPVIKHCIDVLEENDGYGQCLFNNGYREELSEMLASPLGRPRKTQSGVRFYEHEYGPQFNSPCSYWPHFSLRPGVYRVSALQQVGAFIEANGSFEKEYAMRYIDAGWKTAYLEGVYCEHIGRKTKDRHGEQPNAYVLNQTAQFGTFPFKSFIVHLDRRTDRLDRLQLPASPPMTLVSAVDGQKLSPNRYLNGLFRDNTYDMKPGVVGCALSQLKLWQQLLREYKEYPFYFILEDDVEFIPQFEDEFNRLINHIANNFFHWDIIYLGTTSAPTQVTTSDYLYQPKTFAESFAYSHGGHFGYLINHTGALKLLDFISTHGMVNAIDTVVQKAINYGMRVFYVQPPLVFTQSLDSNIQINEPLLYDASHDRATWPEISEYIDSVQ